MVDLANFALGYDAYATHLEQTTGKSDEILQAGRTLVKRWVPALTEAIEQHMVPITSDSEGALLKTPVERMDLAGLLVRGLPL
jgi:hypothetical protein